MNLSKRSMLYLILGLVLGGVLSACSKSEKQSAAGGGSSTQSVMTLKGAAR